MNLLPASCIQLGVLQQNIVERNFLILRRYFEYDWVFVVDLSRLRMKSGADIRLDPASLLLVTPCRYTLKLDMSEVHRCKLG